MMVSSTGQMQAVPQTPQQKAQTELETKSAESQAEARREFPKIEQKAQEMLANIEALPSHPGFKGVIGAPDTLSGLAYKMFGAAPPGTDEAGFTARLDQIGGQQFLQAFESLKGGGAISEVEGTKASNAMSRLAKTEQSEESYLQAADELKTIINKGLANSRAAAGLPLQPSVAQPPSVAGQPIPMLQKPQLVPAAVDVQFRDPLQNIRSGETSFPLESTATGYQPPVASQPPLAAGVTQITSESEYDALPSGTIYSAPNGRTMRKP